MKLPIISFLLLASAALAEEGFSIRHSDPPATIRVQPDGKPYTDFRTDSKVPYCYPLMSSSGACLTRHWPMEDGFKEEERDHPHHRSFWMSHGSVNGHDFWSWKKPENDPRITLRKVGEIKSDSFTVDLVWTAAGKTHLAEARTYAFRYAVLIHHGSIGTANIQDRWKQFSSPS